MNEQNALNSTIPATNDCHGRSVNMPAHATSTLMNAIGYAAVKDKTKKEKKQEDRAKEITMSRFLS
jgi:hypothetical protein